MSESFKFNKWVKTQGSSFLDDSKMRTLENWAYIAKKYFLETISETILLLKVGFKQ